MPALATAMSSPPKDSAASSIPRRIVSRSATSAVTGTKLPPAALTNSPVSLRSLISTAMIEIPSPANATANERPIPTAAPVTSATCGSPFAISFLSPLSSPEDRVHLLNYRLTGPTSFVWVASSNAICELKSSVLTGTTSLSFKRALIVF